MEKGTSGNTSSDTESIDSDSPGVQKFDPLNDAEEQGTAANLSKHVTRILSTQEGMDRVASLARVLSTKTKKDMDSFEINKENFDLELLLKYLRDRSAEQGIEPANAGVAFHDVTCWGIDASAATGPSVTELCLDLLQFWKKFKKNNSPQRKIIENFVGVLEPGEMVLCLGKPGAGCSSLLKAVAGEIENFTKVEGVFSYDGLDQEHMMKHFKGYVVYNPELDFHFPYITVKETIQLALRCKTPEKRVDNMSREEYVDNMLRVSIFFLLIQLFSSRIEILTLQPPFYYYSYGVPFLV